MEMNNEFGMKPCIKCGSSEVGSELRCMASYVATKCYSCSYEGPTSMDRDAAKRLWNEAVLVKDDAQ